jgi:transposase InsO family protein
MSALSSVTEDDAVQVSSDNGPADHIEQEVIEEEVDPEENFLFDSAFLSHVYQSYVSQQLFEVPVSLAGKAAKAMIDTGANVNLVNEDVADALTCCERDTNISCTIRLANGSCVKPLARIYAPLTIHGRLIDPRTPFLVMQNLPFDVIIGLKFLQDNYATLVFGPECNRLVIGEQVYDCLSAAKDLSPEVPAFAATQQRLRARSEAIIRVRVPGVKTGSVYVLSGLPSLAADGLHAGATMSKARDGCLLLRVANLKNKSVILRSQRQVGFVTPVDHVSAPLCQQQHDGACHLNHVTAATACSAVEDITSSPAFQKAVSEFSYGSQLTESQKCELKELLLRYPDCISVHDYDIGKTSLLEHHIDTGDAPPQRRHPYRISPMEQRKVDELISQMKAFGIIRESNSPWAAPIVLIKKKDGSIRFCCDWRDLNAVSRKDSFPLPRIDDTLDRLGQMKFFTTFDFRQGFYHIPMAADSIEKTAFVTPSGAYEWLRGGMGMTNMPSEFQRLMQKMLGNLLFTSSLCYLDDCITFSRTFEQHKHDLTQVLDRIRFAGLKLKPSKCTIAADSIMYLGHIVDREGVRCDPAKIEKVKNWPALRNRRDVRSFLGLASYYRRFIEGFARIAYPLTQLTSESVEFVWSDAAEAAFQELKKRLVSAPIIALPDFERPFILSCDASDFAIGAVLKQLDDKGRERVIAYYSRSLTPTQQAYSASERECLALVSAIKSFRSYLYGSPFTVYTDHSALTCLDNVKNPNGRLARWSLYLRDFTMKIKYKKGTANGDADALSRRGPDSGLQPESDRKMRPFDVVASARLGQQVTLRSSVNGLICKTAGTSVKPGAWESDHCYCENVNRESMQSDVSGVRLESALLTSSDQSCVNVSALDKNPTACGVVGKTAVADALPVILLAAEAKYSSQLRLKRSEYRCHMMKVNSSTKGTCLSLRHENSVPDPDSETPSSEKFVRSLRKAQRDQHKEPSLTAIIRLLEEPDAPLVVPESAKFSSEKGRQRRERMLRNRRNMLLERYRLSDDGLLLTKVNMRVTSQSYDDFEQEYWVFCVPESFRHKVLLMCHDDKLAGHFGFRRTFERVRRQFHFPRMRDYVGKFVYSCIRCRQTKADNQKTAGFLKPLPVPDYERPFTRVCMDKFGAIKGSANGYNYVFTAIDLFTKFAIAAPYASGQAKDAAHFFLNHVCAKMGFPSLLVTDRGSEFNGTDFTTLLSCTPVKLINSTSRHPQTQGSVERLNGLLSQYINVYRESTSHSDWDEYVPFACYAYNTSVHRVTGFSPFFLLYGYNPAIFAEARALIPSYESLEQLRKTLEHARQIACKKLKVAKKADAKTYNKKRRAVNLRKGDYVMLDTVPSDKNKSARLLDRRIGPFIVDAVNEDNTVILRDRERNKTKVNVSRVHKRP